VLVRTLRRAAVPLVAVALLMTLMPGVATAATRPTTFQLYLGSSCIDGNSSDKALVTVVWRSASGTLKLKETIRASGSSYNGWWMLCAQQPRVLKVGDTIKATVGSTTRKFTVPKLTLRPDRVDDVFRGTAPAGTKIRLTYSGALFADYDVYTSVNVRADGTWRYSPPNFDIVGGLYASARWKSAKGDRVTIDVSTPFMIVTLGKARFEGAATPGVLVRAKLKDAATGDVKAIGEAKSNIYGGFSGQFRNAAGKTVPLAAGLRLVAPKVASDAKWIVPNITGSASAATDVVDGRCFDAGSSARFFSLEVTSPDGSDGGSAHGKTAANGSFKVDFSDGEEGLFYWPTDVQSGDTILIRCLQTTGDWVQLRFPVP
jgi:hypothetical protein